MALLTYERGDSDRPVGHAFLYFTSGDDVVATYIVVSPVAFDFGRYVPPLLASSFGSSGLLAQASFFPIPPVPEPYDLPDLRRLADWRGDDVLVERGTTVTDPAMLITKVAEIGEAYAAGYQAALERQPAAATPAISASDNFDGLALLYSVLNEHERMEEIAKRLGTLRYALEGGDQAMVESTCAEMRAIAAHLPASYRSQELIAAARRPDPDSARLAQLYVERGYKLSSADDEGVPALDAEIESLERNHA